MLVVLETLSPTERAVFVLREVFGFDYDDTAAAAERFLAAASTGDMAGLVSLLAPDITWTTDSGGKVTALRDLVMVGAERVGPILMAVFAYARPQCGSTR